MKLSDLIDKCKEQQEIQKTGHAFVTLRLLRLSAPGERVRLWNGGPYGAVVASTMRDGQFGYEVVAMFYANEILAAVAKMAKKEDNGE